MSSAEQPQPAAHAAAQPSVDPRDVLGISDDEVSFAEALRGFAARYEQHAERLLGVGEDLLAEQLRKDEDADPQALRQALTPRIRPLLEAAAALEVLSAQTALASGALTAATPDGEGARPDALLAPEPDLPWPAPPGEQDARAALAAWARRTPLVPGGLFDGMLEVDDASVARLTVTRVVQRVSETRMWTAGAPPELPEYDGDDPAAAAGAHRGWEDQHWEGIRAGSVNKRSCSTCGGDGRLRCGLCAGSMFERCPPFETCRICRGSGRTRRRGTLRRFPCDVCNARGVVPCPACGGMGRRPCSGCTDGNVGCQRCRGYGRVTEYLLAAVDRTVHSETVPVGEEGPFRDRPTGYRRVATLARYRRLEGIPEPADEALRAVLATGTDGQLRQKVEVEALSAARVRYRRGSTARTAWVLGEQREVLAPRVRLPTVPPGALVIVAAFLTALLLIVATRGGETP
jgi:hypothetical protein